MLYWLTNYLTLRQQYVSSTICLSKCGQFQFGKCGQFQFVRCLLSSPRIITWATPVTYFNNKVKRYSRGNHPRYTQTFAEDTDLFLHHNDLKTLENNTNFALSHLNDWFAVNKLSLNISKTSYMLFCPSQKFQLIYFLSKLEIIHLERVSCGKYLGVFIDESMVTSTFTIPRRPAISSQRTSGIESRTTRFPTLCRWN